MPNSIIMTTDNGGFSLGVSNIGKRKKTGEMIEKYISERRTGVAI